MPKRGREVGVGEAVGAAESLERIEHVGAVADHVADVLGDAPERGADDREARGPAGERAALQAPGELERGAQRAAGGTRARREDARAEVAAGGEPGRGDGQQRGEREQRRAAATSARPRTGGAPAPSRAARARRPRAGRRRRSRAARTPRRARAIASPLAPRAGLGDLRRGRADARRTRARPRRTTRRARARRRTAGRSATTAERDDHAERDARQRGGDQRRGQRRVAADDARADELRPAGLLLGARVADDEQDAINPPSASAMPPSRQADEAADGVARRCARRARAWPASCRASARPRGARPRWRRASSRSDAVTATGRAERRAPTPGSSRGRA